MRNLIESNSRGKQSSISYTSGQKQRKSPIMICKKKPYSCVICHKSFQTHSILATHSAKDHPQQQHEYHSHKSSLTRLQPILKREETMVSRNSQSRHFGSCTSSVFGHPCPVCQRVFASVHDCDAHQRTSHATLQTATKASTQFDTDFSDTYPPGNDTTSSTLAKNKHSHYQHNNNNADPGVNINSKQLSSMKILCYTVPSSSKPFQCEVCTRTFSRLSHLTAHEQIHSNEKCFKCCECGKDFLRAASLSQHQRCHNEQK